MVELLPTFGYPTKPIMFLASSSVCLFFGEIWFVKNHVKNKKENKKKKENKEEKKKNRHFLEDRV
jgi:hypothetical protein